MKSESFSDQTTLEITKLLYNQFIDEAQEQKLDLKHLEDFFEKQIKPLYPMKENMQISDGKLEEYACREFCCQLDPGRFCCLNTQPSDDVFKSFGLGFCLFVKFLKHLTLFLFAISVISLVPLIFYYCAAGSSNFSIVESYQNLLFSGTSGILSQSYSRCEYSELTDLGSSYEVTFQNTCITGTFNFVGIAFTNRTLNSVYNCRLQHQYSTPIDQTSISPQPTNDAQSNKDLTFEIPKESKDGDYAVYLFQCVNSIYTAGNTEIDSSQIMVVAVVIDIFIVILFIFFLVSENSAEKKQINEFKVREFSIHDFSVQLHGFTLENIQKEVEHFVRNYTWKKSNVDVIQQESDDRIEAQNMEDKEIKNQEFYDNIVQIKIPESEQLRESIQKRREQYEKLYKFMQKHIFKKEQNFERIKEPEKFKKLFFKDEEKYTKYKMKLKQMVVKFMRYRFVKYKADKKTPYPLYIVMRSPDYKKKIFKSRKKQFFKDTIHVGDKEYTISQPPAADMIIWKNYHKWTIFRVIFVWILTLIICFGSYLLVGLAIYGRDNLLSQNFSFNNDCSVLYTENQLQNYQSELKAEDSYISCYCEYQFFNNVQASGDCVDWARQYSILVGIPFLISFGVVIYNILVSKFFRVMTKFEGHKTVTAQLYSYVIKRAFILIMNMGLIVLILELKFNNFLETDDLIFLFSGTFTDITSDWYLRIGAIICLTLAFNIFLPIFQMLFLALLRSLRICWDKRCCRATSQTTKKGYLQLFINNQFPIEERYADLIAIIAITLTFSAVIPMTYILSFLSFGFMYLCDKILLFRVYQKPINYSASLQRKVFKTIYFFLIIHCFSSLFLLSEEGLINATHPQHMYEVEGSDQRFQNIIEVPYFIPYIAIFAILIIFAFFNSTIKKLIQRCKHSSEDGAKSSIKHIKGTTDFFSVLTPFHIQQLKVALTKQKNVLKSHTQSDSEILKIAPLLSSILQMHAVHERSLMEMICDRTLKNVHDLQKKPMKGQRSMALDNVKLIGLAGYEQMFDNEAFIRQKKIRKLDELCGKVIGKQFYLRSQQSSSQKGHYMQINLDDV